MSYKVTLCGEDISPYLRPPEPPKVTNCTHHTPRPSGYGDFFVWAAALAKTHRQERCDECGLYAIWRKRQAAQGSQE